MTYIAADIHGRADRFHEVLEAVNFSDDDSLYILGDVIDRNADGIQLLQEIMTADNMQMILGNHEYMMLNAIEDPEYHLTTYITNLDLWFYNGGGITAAAFDKLSYDAQNEILDFIKNLPINLEVNCGGRQYMLVHGSPVSMFDAAREAYGDAVYYAVWNRFDAQKDSYDSAATLICGHTPTAYMSEKFPMEVYSMNNVMFIDCGCAYKTEEGGRLACLCLETGEIIYSTV